MFRYQVCAENFDSAVENKFRVLGIFTQCELLLHLSFSDY